MIYVHELPYTYWSIRQPVKKKVRKPKKKSTPRYIIEASNEKLVTFFATPFLQHQCTKVFFEKGLYTLFYYVPKKMGWILVFCHSLHASISQTCLPRYIYIYIYIYTMYLRPKWGQNIVNDRERKLIHHPRTWKIFTRMINRDHAYIYSYDIYYVTNFEKTGQKKSYCGCVVRCIGPCVLNFVLFFFLKNNGYRKRTN